MLKHIDGRQGSVNEAFVASDERERPFCDLLTILDEKIKDEVWAYKGHGRLVLSNSSEGGQAIILQIAHINDLFNIGFSHPMPIEGINREGNVIFEVKDPNETAILVADLVKIWLKLN